MRLLRLLTGQLLPCGCLVGIYETYDARVIASIDARGHACGEHHLHQTLSSARTPPDRRPDDTRADEAPRAQSR
jgi:hypothetical protein